MHAETGTSGTDSNGCADVCRRSMNCSPERAGESNIFQPWITDSRKIMIQTLWQIVAENRKDGTQKVLAVGAEGEVKKEILSERCQRQCENMGFPLLFIEPINGGERIFADDIIEGHTNPLERWLIVKSGSNWLVPQTYTALGTYTAIRNTVFNLLKEDRERSAIRFTADPEVSSEIKYLNDRFWGVDEYENSVQTMVSAVPMDSIPDVEDRKQ